MSHVAYWKDSGAPVPHTFTNVGGLLTFDNVPIVPSETQFIIEITVVLDATPTNVNGKQFVNTAKWDFGRLIDGVFYEPLPGEWGISPPMTIAAPELVVTKTGPATMNLGVWGQFALDVRNTGLFDAWQVTMLDRLPDGGTGGMCSMTPQVLSAQVFAADGVTPVPGKGPLIPGTDFSLNYSGSPACELTLNVLTAKGTIGPGERLIITYRTQLDADTQNGVTLTNVAGAIRWFNGDTSNTGSPDLHAHAHQRHGRHARPRGRTHRYSGTLGLSSSRRPLRISRAARTRPQQPLRATDCATRCACRPPTSRSITPGCMTSWTL